MLIMTQSRTSIYTHVRISFLISYNTHISNKCMLFLLEEL